ncbi:cytochrome c3 family protein [Enhygromyxa salina]|uniref:Class III cytochrome C family protein n=1 Tax=Enhygromyxa salina TaxID=215803 RepID=A0A2S9YPB4_9BACT|nr:cytochrome c3 family protein [Enhygromyxa salina]PRQ06912.1 Class III cytochrome C family protein [Enhygromyxa salina]
MGSTFALAGGVAQLFPASVNFRVRASLWTLAIGAVVLSIVAVASSRSDWSTGQGRATAQPVQFSHAHHVGGVGIDCRYCHRSVDTEAFAGMPSTQTCMHCHSQLWTEAAMLAPVRQSWANGRPLRWRRVHDLPDFAYFDHGAHVQAEVACSTCHGEVERMALTVQAAPLTMRWCVDCHADLPARYGLPAQLSCSTCHR